MFGHERFGYNIEFFGSHADLRGEREFVQNLRENFSALSHDGDFFGGFDVNHNGRIIASLFTVDFLVCMG